MAEITVIKRDGSEEDFDVEKVSASIMGAAMDVGGEDIDLADRLANDVLDILEANEVETIDSSELQKLVEKTLIEDGHASTAREYILKAADRSRMREMDTALIKQMEEITFSSEADSEVKRENANIDSSTAMGTMLKYGSEAAKSFNLLYLMSKDVADAHRNGDIHIHDLDFLSLTETCVVADTSITLKEHNEVRTVTAEYLDKFLGDTVDNVVQLDAIEIMSHGKFVKAINCVKHTSDNKKVLKISCGLGDLEVTDEHRVTVIKDGAEQDIKARDLSIGDTLLRDNGVTTKIESINQIEYTGFVYDIETADNHFDANGFVVHNCCQIPLDKLFKHGFNTGHGFLREPGSIRAAGSLAAIAIQSNQNDQHGGQSIPLFDYYLAPYVALSYVKDMAYITKEKLDLSKEQHAELKSRLVEYQKQHDRVMNDTGYSDIRKILKEFFKENYIKVTNKRIDKIFEDSYDKVYDETFQSMEAFIHNLNTMHSRAGAQVPFSSINYGTDTSTEGRIIMETVLKTTWEGLGTGETPIFPIQIFKLKAGVSYNPEDPNYDLFKLACKVSAKRLYPNFVNLDAPYNAELYIPGHPETEMATMGCVEGHSVINYKLNSVAYNESFIDAWDRLSKLHKISVQGESEYCELNNVLIYDSSSEKYVTCKKIIRNHNVTKWFRIEVNGNTLVATHDHPLNTEETGRAFVEDIKVGMHIAVVEDNKAVYREISSIEETTVDDVYSYDVETESDRFDVNGFASHNCRTRVGKNIYDPDKSVIPGRGNLSFTSINLPRLGIMANGNVDVFFKLLDEKLELVHKQLLERFELQCKKHPVNYPFLMGQGNWLGSDNLGPNDDLRAVLKHGTLTVGFIGLAETLVALIGKHHGESEEAQELGLKIVQHMRDYTDAWSENEHMNYSVIGTPAEGLSGRFVRMDKKLFGEIPGVTDRDYYTNSSHVPVYYPITAYKKIAIEAPYHSIENGGHILYIEMDGDPTTNLKAFEKIVRCMHDKNAGYFAINHPVDRDPLPACGYVGIIDDICPRCGRREGEPMTMEMWNKLHGYMNAGNADTLGYHGDPAEEADRLPNPVGNIKMQPRK